MSKLIAVAGLAVILTTVALLAPSRVVSSLPIPVVYDPTWVQYMWLGVAGSLAPFSISRYRRTSYLQRLEEQVPAAIRVIADSIAAGLNVGEGIEILARSNLDPMRRVAARAVNVSILAGKTLEDSLVEVCERTGSPTVHQFSLIITSAARGGAKVRQVLELAEKAFSSIIEYRRQKYMRLKPYAVLFHMVILVYALVAGVVIYGVIPQLNQLTVQAPARIGGGITVVRMDPLVAVALAVYLAVIQAFVGGLALGRIIYERATAGLIHSVVAILIVVTVMYCAMPYVPVLLGTKPIEVRCILVCPHDLLAP